MMLEATLALAAYVMAALALIISLWVWLVVDEMKKNGISWIQLNRELKNKIEQMEKSSPTSPWKK